MLGDSIRRRRGPALDRQEPLEEREIARRAGGFGWARVTMAALLAAGVLFAVGYLFATRVLYPPLNASGDLVFVPDVTGIPHVEARAAVEAAGLSTAQPTELPHPDAGAGTVIAQEPLAGQGLRPGGTVRFAISSGPSRLRVPDLVGFPVATARDVLERAGVSVLVQERPDPSPAGRVLEMDPPPGSQRPLPSRVILVVSGGPPAADTLPEGEAPAIPPPVIPPRR